MSIATVIPERPDPCWRVPSGKLPEAAPLGRGFPRTDGESRAWEMGRARGTEARDCDRATVPREAQPAPVPPGIARASPSRIVICSDQARRNLAALGTDAPSARIRPDSAAVRGDSRVFLPIARANSGIDERRAATTDQKETSTRAPPPTEHEGDEPGEQARAGEQVQVRWRCEVRGGGGRAPISFMRWVLGST